ncbi:hypothetical protein LIA77_10588 [Sarocladium implicatum]|nr:hypothetical protein LIA77_10588 [Sarocladium implicatum]
MAEAFSCQICGLDMATARIRTPNEPPSAAWDWRGLNYVGFSQFRDYHGNTFPDRDCQECTTADRTPAEIRTAEYSNLWPENEDEDEDDAEWLPSSRSQSDEIPLEYDSEAEVSDGISAGSWPDELHQDRDGNDDQFKWRAATSAKYPLSEIYVPPQPERQPHGTWRDGLIFSRGPDGSQATETMTWAFRESRAPLEHIASRTCQSLQGINGHVLSLAEMKSCRNHRFLVPKPLNWTSTEVADKFLEDGNLFYLTGESNGSDHFMYRYLYPARHGLGQMVVNCDSLNVDDGFDTVHPIPVHSYCLDMYAKVSYRRHRRVDLDGLFHWRKMQSCPQSYNLGELSLRRQPEVDRGREHIDHPWHHHSGDEWLVANPVEIQGIQDALTSCMSCCIGEEVAFSTRSRFAVLPAEIVISILALLDMSGMSAVALTCRRLYKISQPCFKVYVTKNMRWLWELFEDTQYPTSPDWPVTWDPLCPPGLIPPSLPIGLESKEDEDERWNQIIADDAEMEEIGNMVRALNDSRREEVFGPYRAKQEASLREWQDFRAGVATWICHLPDQGNRDDQSLDWLRIWQIFEPCSTQFLGVRNRARIWDVCEHIIETLNKAQEAGGLDAERSALSTKLSSLEYWSEVHGQ